MTWSHHLEADVARRCLVRAAGIMRQTAQHQAGNDRDDDCGGDAGDEGLHIKTLPEQVTTPAA